MSVPQIRALYASMPDRIAQARRKFGRPLTLTPDSGAIAVK